MVSIHGMDSKPAPPPNPIGRIVVGDFLIDVKNGMIQITPDKRTPILLHPSKMERWAKRVYKEEIV